MKRQFKRISGAFFGVLVLAAWTATAWGQVAVPEIEEIQEIPLISDSEIEELIGPIALYPDDLLAVVLPAATFPLQIVEAGRFLEDLEDNPSLEPDSDWDDSIVALLNYPEVVELMNEDLDWTWRLGEAVVGQQSDVISAIERFRDRAYAAGNLKSDDYQLVAEEGGTIEITPVAEDVIYVPYYEPEEVVVYQPRPVYFYHPRPYPVYYYPYPTYYSFYDRFYHHRFWGVTTAFSVAWTAHHLSVYHHSYYGHPYYGRTYWNNYWYRRPDIHIHNNIYVRNNVNVSTTRYRNGDHWQPSNRRTVSYTDQRITRTRYYPNSTGPSRPSSTSVSTPSRNRPTASDSGSRTRTVYVGRGDEREKIEFQPRASRPTTPTASRAPGSSSSSFTPKPRTETPTVTRSTTKPQVSTTRPTRQVPTRTATPRATATAKPTPTRSSSSVRPAPTRSSSASRPAPSRSSSASSSRSSKPQSSAAPKSSASQSRSTQRSAPTRSRSSSSSNGSRASAKKER